MERPDRIRTAHRHEPKRRVHGLRHGDQHQRRDDDAEQHDEDDRQRPRGERRRILLEEGWLASRGQGGHANAQCTMHGAKEMPRLERRDRRVAPSIRSDPDQSDRPASRKRPVHRASASGPASCIDSRQPPAAGSTGSSRAPAAPSARRACRARRGGRVRARGSGRRRGPC